MKKIISVLLTLVMLLTVAVIPAVAETTTSVVYYVNGEAVKTVDSLEAGSEYTVDFIPSNTNEQYFSGWYYDSEFKNEARTKFTLAEGENKLYARMENYKKEINLSTNLEQGDPINVYKWHEIENAWYSDMRWFAGYYRYYNNEVQDILPLLSTLHHIYNSDGSVYSRNFQGWTQNGVFVIVDGEGNAVVPKPSTKYKVTVDFTSNSGNAASMSLQTAWKFSEVDMYSSGNTTFNENRVHQNGNSAHEYGSANFKTTAGVYATDYISTQATTNKQTLTFELTTPSIETYISNNYYQILGFRLSIPGNDYISFQSIKIEQVCTSVEYIVNGETVKNVESLTAGSEYTIDYIPANTNEQYFSGWYYDSEFKNEARTKFTLANGENKLYARMENYKDVINLSTDSEQGDPINVYKWHEIENVWYSDMRWFAGYYRYYNNEVQDILPLLSTLHHIYNSDGSVYSRNFQGWTQSGVFVIVDGEGNAVVPKPSTKYKVTVDFTSNSGNAASMSLQTAWKFSEVDMYSSGNTTFNENRVHQNSNSAHEYGSANFKTTAGVYATDYISTQATTNKQTLTFELTTPSIETYISNNYYQILGFRLSIPGNDYISFQSIKIENMSDKKCSVEYYNADGSSAGLVENLEIGETYNPDRMPTKAAEDGKTFVGWKTADGKMVDSNGVTLAETGNKLYAVYTDVVTENKTVNLYNSNITNGKLYNAYLYDGVYKGYIPYEHNGGYGPKNEITQGTDAPYTRFTSGQYNGMSATYMFDENAVALQGKWDTTYTITLKYRMPAMDEENPIIIQPFFGINKAKVNSIDAVNFSDPSTVKTLARANGLKTYWAYNFKGGADEYRFSNNAAINENANTALQHNIVEPSNEWQTLTFFVETGAENNDYLPLFALYVNVQINGVQGGYNSNVVDVKDITITECRVDKKLDTATVAGRDVAYAKISDYVEDKETYKVVLRGAADSWADIAFMTANAESINDNQGFVEGANKPIVSFGYGSIYIKTVYITIDKFGDGQGDALYLYITGGADKVKSMSVIEIEKLTDKNGGSLIGNMGVSMLDGLPEDAKQALRYYFTYDTSNGSDIIIDGKSYAIKSRGFLLANADTVGNSAVTRATAANSSDIIDVNKSSGFENCWHKTTNSDGTENLWFSTYVKGFEPDGGYAYNDSQRLYVKGYVVITIEGNNVVLYGKESAVTVKEVYDNLGSNGFVG